MLHKMVREITRDCNLKALQSHLSPWEGYQANPPGDHVQAHEGQEDDWEWPVWIFQGHCIPGHYASFLQMTGSVDDGRVVAVYLDFSKIFNRVSHSILTVQLVTYGMDR